MRDHNRPGGRFRLHRITAHRHSRRRYVAVLEGCLVCRFLRFDNRLCNILVSVGTGRFVQQPPSSRCTRGGITTRAINYWWCSSVALYFACVTHSTYTDNAPTLALQLFFAGHIKCINSLFQSLFRNGIGQCLCVESRCLDARDRRTERQQKQDTQQGTPTHRQSWSLAKPRHLHLKIL